MISNFISAYPSNLAKNQAHTLLYHVHMDSHGPVKIPDPGIISEQCFPRGPHTYQHPVNRVHPTGRSVYFTPGWLALHAQKADIYP